jgi:two-component system, NarL family, nitrate/nitrite response regulator NarL
MNHPYRVLIADDHHLARRAVRSLLEDDPRFEVIGEARGGREAVEQSALLAPDVVLLDIRMPDLNGLEATRLIKQQNPASKVVILSVSDSVQDLFTAIQYGAQGYLLKDMDPADWLSYLHALLNEGSEVSRQLADKLFHRFKSMPERSGQVHKENRDGWRQLTAREQEIALCVAEGATNRQISEQLYISEHTVKNHMKNVLEKLDLDNRVQLAAYAIRMGLLKEG